MRKLDRYIFGQLSFPFLSSLLGLLIFISLSLAIQLSDLLLGRGRAFWEVFYLLFLKVPDFLVFAMPISLLFAVFTVFARLVDDEEIVAFQLGGYSLKRIVVPVLVFGLVVSIAALAVNNYLVPWSSTRYRENIYRIARGSTSPLVKSDVFFKGPEGRTFYVGSYDPDSNLMEDVLVFDHTGEYLAGGAEENSRYPVLISCDKASFQGGEIRLEEGWIVRLDERGQVVSTVQFDGFRISLKEDLKEVISQGRRPDEMKIGRLKEKIESARSGGLEVDNLILALHSKISLPMAALVFALFSGPVSLVFLHRSKAVGILLTIAFGGAFQGLLLWTRTLVDRSSFSPVLAAWLPDIVLGAIGLGLFVFLDRMSGLRPGRRVREWFSGVIGSTFLMLIVAFLVVGSFPLYSEELPVDLRARRVKVIEGSIRAEGNVVVSADDWNMSSAYLNFKPLKGEDDYRFEAKGDVKLDSGRFSITGSILRGEIQAGREEAELHDLRMEEGRGGVENLDFSGDLINLIRKGKELSEVEIIGEARLNYGDSSTTGGKIRLEIKEESYRVCVEGSAVSKQGDVELSGKRMTFNLGKGERGITGGEVEAKSIEGIVPFTVENGEEKRLYYGGKKASFKFDRDNQLKLGSVSQGWFSTCSCCGEIRNRPYAFGADRIKLYGENLVIARSVSLRGFGWPLGWFPFYFIPLDELKRRPYFPEAGYSSRKGYFFNLEIPYSLNHKNYGTTIWDFNTKGPGLGFGLNFFSREKKNRTDLSFYFLNRSLDDNYYKLMAEGGWRHLPFFRLNYDVDYKLGPLEGKMHRKNEWKLSLTPKESKVFRIDMSRKESEEKYRGGHTDYVLERLPRFSLSLSETLGPLKLGGGLSAGHYREFWPELSEQDFGFKSGLGLNTELALLSGKYYRSFLNTSWGADGYFAGSDFSDGFRGFYQFEPALVVGGGNRIRFSYLHRCVYGNSPFYFDQKSTLGRLRVDYKGAEGDFSQSIDLNYTFSPREKRGFSPLKYGFSYEKGGRNLKLGLRYGLENMTFQKLSLDAGWGGKEAGIGISTTCDLKTGVFKDTKLTGRFATGENKLKLTADIGSRLQSVEKFYWKGELFPFPEWKLVLEGSYEFSKGKFAKFEYGLLRQFRGCLELGLKGDLDGLWFHADIVDFPSEGD